MFNQIFDSLFGTPAWRRRPDLAPRARRRSARLEVLQLEDRTVPSDLLGTAASFAVLGGSEVTNTGPSVINGDLGVSPGSAVTGFTGLPEGTVNGVIHAADAVALQAQSDVTIAYNDLAGRAVTQTLTGQDLGLMTLTPGVYFFSTSAQLTGQLTLDFQGNPDALFVFQIGSTLTTASSSSVVMINTGDQELGGCEVYWQVGSSATLGTTTEFVGNIVALTSITLNTGANIFGRALARNGAVTLDTNVITMPECETAIAGSISGVSFNDLNGNGVRDQGEPGLQGVTVFIDANDNGVLDDGEERRTTGADGSYTFGGLEPGTYRVRQDLPEGIVQTTPNPDDITIEGDEDVSGVDFGDFILISISGAKFRDANGNGVRNAGEPGLQGWTIYIDANNNGVLDATETRTTTDIDGNFTFENLGPGTHRIREVGRFGWVQMTTNPDVTGTSGADVTVSFGNARAAALVPPSKLSLIGRNMAPGVLARQARFVANLYQDLLNRAPDRAGLRHYVRLLQAGFSRNQVRAMFRADFGL